MANQPLDDVAREVAATDFQNYVREILADMPAGISRDTFRARCQRDINAGYGAEVAEAETIYFREKKHDN